MHMAGLYWYRRQVFQETRHTICSLMVLKSSRHGFPSHEVESVHNNHVSRDGSLWLRTVATSQPSTTVIVQPVDCQLGVTSVAKEDLKRRHYLGFGTEFGFMNSCDITIVCISWITTTNGWRLIRRLPIGNIHSWGAISKLWLLVNCMVSLWTCRQNSSFKWMVSTSSTKHLEEVTEDVLNLFSLQLVQPTFEFALSPSFFQLHKFSLINFLPLFLTNCFVLLPR